MKIVLFFLISGFVCLAPAQVVNRWTNSVSAHWEEGFWSLGTLPAQDQSVQITNAAWKAVGIFPSTPVDYPASMSVRDLTVSADPGSFNLLLSSNGPSTAQLEGVASSHFWSPLIRTQLE